MDMRRDSWFTRIAAVLLALSLCLLPSCDAVGNYTEQTQDAASQAQITETARSAEKDVSVVVSLDDIPEYSGEPYVEIDGGVPSFTEDERSGNVVTEYSGLDSLGRTGKVTALITPESVSVGERQSIGMIKPSGWHLVKYDCVDGKYLFNRCHLLAHQNGGIDEIENLITGTRYLNTQGMLPFENDIADCVKGSGCSVCFRATPIYTGDELVARGVQMEAYSVEDAGSTVCFNVYCYNVQPYIAIDYATGESALAEEAAQSSGDSNKASAEEDELDYILNTNTKRFHYPDCPSVDDIKEKNKGSFHGKRSELTDQGYEPCGRCKP